MRHSDTKEGKASRLAPDAGNAAPGLAKVRGSGGDLKLETSRADAKESERAMPNTTSNGLEQVGDLTGGEDPGTPGSGVGGAGAERDEATVGRAASVRARRRNASKLPMLALLRAGSGLPRRPTLRDGGELPKAQ